MRQIMIAALLVIAFSTGAQAKKDKGGKVANKHSIDLLISKESYVLLPPRKQKDYIQGVRKAYADFEVSYNKNSSKRAEFNIFNILYPTAYAKGADYCLYGGRFLTATNGRCAISSYSNCAKDNTDQTKDSYKCGVIFGNKCVLYPVGHVEEISRACAEAAKGNVNMQQYAEFKARAENIYQKVCPPNLAINSAVANDCDVLTGQIKLLNNELIISQENQIKNEKDAEARPSTPAPVLSVQPKPAAKATIKDDGTYWTYNNKLEYDRGHPAVAGCDEEFHKRGAEIYETLNEIRKSTKCRPKKQNQRIWAMEINFETDGDKQELNQKKYKGITRERQSDATVRCYWNNVTINAKVSSAKTQKEFEANAAQAKMHSSATVYYSSSSQGAHYGNKLWDAVSGNICVEEPAPPAVPSARRSLK
jgi:hypothetical protein